MNDECWVLRLLENDPVPSLRILKSSSVGSHTKSSHIWQYTAPALDSTSRVVSPYFQPSAKAPTESVLRLIPMSQTVLLCRCCRTLQAQEIRRESNQRLLVCRLRSLANNRIPIQDYSQAVLIM